MTNNLLLS